MEIAQGSENISQQVEEQTATIQEVNAISENLSQKSMALTNVIAHFRLAP